MSHKANGQGFRLRFSLRSALVAMLLAGLALGSVLTIQRTRREAARRIQELQRQISYLEQKREFDLDHLQNQLEAAFQENQRPKRILFGALLNGAELEGISITNTENSFQRAQFCDCDLTKATLTGGGASFQSSRFDDANLTHASLTGGNASFQGASFTNAELNYAVMSGGGGSFQNASFVNADLAGSTLSGGGGAFQGASFDGANAQDARISVGDRTAFSSVSIDKTDFRGADLSSISSRALDSCHFVEPPVYDAKTKFPPGFNAAVAGWREWE